MDSGVETIVVDWPTLATVTITVAIHNVRSTSIPVKLTGF
jgi:hypothetical protein